MRSKVQKNMGLQRNDMEVKDKSDWQGDDALNVYFLSRCFTQHLTTINIKNSLLELYLHYHEAIVLFFSMAAFNVFDSSSLQKYSKQQILSNPKLQPQFPLFPLCDHSFIFPNIPFTLARSCPYFLYLFTRALHLLSQANQKNGGQAANQPDILSKHQANAHANPNPNISNAHPCALDDQNWRFPNLILQQLIIMSLNSSSKATITNQLSTYSIDLTLPFKVCTTPSRKTSKYERDGHWNQKQRLKYAIFLSYFHDLFLDPIKKKSIKIYDMMADMIITRNSNQCRSHHQKMEKYRNSVPEIINRVAEKYQPRVYKELEGKYLLLIKVLLENREKYMRAAPLQERNKGGNDKSVVIRMDEMEEVRESQVKVDVRPVKENIEIESFGEIKEAKEKNVKTTDTYLQEKGDSEDDQSIQGIPIMTLSDPKIEQESQKPQNEANDPLFFSFKQPYQDQNLFSFQKGLQLTLQGITYYQQQIKMLQLKKQWHVHNLQQLSAQLLSEKQSIKLCDSSIKLYQMAINSSVQ